MIGAAMRMLAVLAIQELLFAWTLLRGDDPRPVGWMCLAMGVISALGVLLVWWLPRVMKDAFRGQ